MPSDGGAHAEQSGAADPAAFNLADLVDAVAGVFPERAAIGWRDAQVSFGELRERSDRLAAAMVRAGVRRGDTVGLLLYNSPAYLEALLATFKIGAISFNINYSYGAEELRYILDDAQAAGLVHGEEFTPILAEVLPRLAPLKMRMVVEAPNSAPADQPGLLSYRQALADPVGDTDIRTGRSGDDRMLLYTGGTTGMPKGVEWSQGDFFLAALTHAHAPVNHPDQVPERAATGFHITALGCGPLMHGASLFSAFFCLLAGGTYVLASTSKFDPVEIWDLVDRHAVNSLSVIGDAMVAPLVEAWDAHPGRWAAASLFSVGSGGAAFTPRLQDAVKERLPKVMLIHGMGSSESGAIGTGDTRTGGDGFMVLPAKPDLAVIVDSVRFAETGELGILARSGPMPRGYWRAPEKTAATFVEVGGRRWVLIGDQAKTEPDGSIRIYGRDSTVINSGGEKVFPEEVESVVRAHPAVLDAVVIGTPHPRWTQAVTAIVSLREGAKLNLEELRDFGAQKLARFKLPQQLIVEPQVKRTAAGKPDVRWAKAIADAHRA